MKEGKLRDNEVNNMKKSSYDPRGGFSVIGTPFEPLDRSEGANTNSMRIMPSQFSFPCTPCNFNLIRETGYEENRINGIF